MTTRKPWWLTDDYGKDEAVPEVFNRLAGPNGLALVRAWPSGLTDPGWGLQGPAGKEGFIPRYERGEFIARRVLHGYTRGKWAFAFIMRSVKTVCIDIDGKNGGFDHVGKLGILPPTLSETSKSGNGYHLFYRYEEPWLPKKGFGTLSDRIGIEQGVDVRATGCVYHHPQQRWNDRLLADLPPHLKELLAHREQKVAEQSAYIISVLASNDPMEILMMQDKLLDALKKPQPEGKRNMAMFAIGNQMRAAQVENWDGLVRTRSEELGLEDDEIDKLIANINQYGTDDETP